MMRNLTALLLLFVSISVNASVIQVSSRSALNPNDYFDWGDVSADNGNPSNPKIALSPLLLDSNSGLNEITGIVGGVGQTYFYRVDEGNSWNGGFSPGDALLWHNNAANRSPVTFIFDQPVFGFGTQFQHTAFGYFQAVVSAFDVNNQLLGSYSDQGTYGTGSNNSQVYLGMLNSDALISRITIDAYSTSLNSAATSNFLFNRLDVVTPGVSAPIPEPETYTMVLLGLAMIGLQQRRRLTQRLSHSE